jgi:dCMP deaminase
MKIKYVNAYMDVAERFSLLSTAQRLKVGAIIVKEDRVISIGYNGMPSGWTNECEYKHYTLGNPNDYSLKTKPEVIHAEANAIAKLAKSSESGKDSVMFLTHSPCIDCAKQIYTAGIKKVYYKNEYRSNDGIDFLNKCGVETVKVSELTQTD